MNAAASPWWVAPAVITGLLTVMLGVLTLYVNGRRARNDRQRQLFAVAIADVNAYCEYPYIVRRRRHDELDAERTRITGELSGIQQRLNHNQAILQVEAPRVAVAHEALVAETRRVAGGAIKEGWNLPPITGDTQVHVLDVDLSGLTPFQRAYLVAACDHLAITPASMRRVLRAARASVSAGISRARLAVRTGRQREQTARQ
jgi:hypothetical protein